MFKLNPGSRKAFVFLLSVAFFERKLSMYTAEIRIVLKYVRILKNK